MPDRTHEQSINLYALPTRIDIQVLAATTLQLVFIPSKGGRPFDASSGAIGFWYGPSGGSQGVMKTPESVSKGKIIFDFTVADLSLAPNQYECHLMYTPLDGEPEEWAMGILRIKDNPTVSYDPLTWDKYLSEAPVDGKLYGRQNEGWTEIPLEDYLTESNASSTYITQANAASTYVEKDTLSTVLDIDNSILYDVDNSTKSIEFNDTRLLYDRSGIGSVFYGDRYLAMEDGTPALVWNVGAIEAYVPLYTYDLDGNNNGDFAAYNLMDKNGNARFNWGTSNPFVKFISNTTSGDFYSYAPNTETRSFYWYNNVDGSGNPVVELDIDHYLGTFEIATTSVGDYNLVIRTGSTNREEINGATGVHTFYNNLKVLSYSNKLYLGAGDDLEIYHDGTNSYIKNNTGLLNFVLATSQGSRFVGNSDRRDVYIGRDIPAGGWGLSLEFLQTADTSRITSIASGIDYKGIEFLGSRFDFLQGNVNIGDTNTSQSSTLTLTSQNVAGIVLNSDCNNAGGEPGGAYTKYLQDGGTIWGEVGVTQTTNATASGQSVLNIDGNDVYLYSNSSPIDFAVGGYTAMKIAADRKLTFYSSSTDTRTGRIYESDGAFIFAKTSGAISTSSNTVFRFGTIGAVTSDNSFWNGFQLQGHTVTDGVANRFPMMTIFSSSTTATNPTDYSLNFSLGNVGATLPTAINYSTQANNNSKITFGFGNETPTSNILNLHYNSSTDILARVKQANNGGGLLIHRNSTTNGTYGGIHFAGTDEAGFITGGYRKAGIFYERIGNGGIGTLHFALDGNANTDNANLSDSKLKITYDGNLHVPNDDQKLYFGAGDDLYISYDGTNAKIVTDGITASDLIVDCGTDKTMVLEEPVWNDIQFSIASGRVGMANFPDWDGFTANTSEYKFDVNDYIDLGANEMPHFWKEGTAVYPHLHITTDGANASGSSQWVKFDVFFAYADDNNVWTETSVPIEKEIVNGTADMVNMIAHGASIAMAGLKIGTQVKIRIKRIAATSGTEYPNHIFVTQCGIHVECDTLGSRQIATK